MKAYLLWLAKLLTLIVVVIVVIPVMFGVLAAIASKSISDDSGLKSSDKGKRVAVVELNGIIMSSRETTEQLYKQIEDPTVKGIVLRVDSPGGAVGPSQEIYSTVKKLKAKKPIVVSMGSLAASGGLYVSVGASKIFAQPGTLTGSIGVIMEIPNFTDIASKVGFSMVTIKSGHLKDVGNSFRKMTDEETEFLQSTVKLSHQDFIDAVADGRNIAIEKVMQFADGRVILGSQAKELGLVDEFGDTYDAARAVFQILGEPLAQNEEPAIFYPADKYKEFKKFLESVTNLPELLAPHFKFSYIMN